LASCFLVSPFREASVVSIDGFGDFSSAAWGVGRERAIDVEGRVYFPHSLGVFYQGITQYLGFPHFGDEYKVMGLAPYGRPEYLPQMRQIVRLREGGSFELDTAYFRHHRENIDYAWEGGSPNVGTLFSPEVAELLGPARNKDEPLTDRHRDIARSAQAMYEEAFFHLLEHLHTRHRLESLALAGGCAMNSVANGKVLRQTPYKRLYVQSAAGDAGGAIGAAMYAWHQLAGARQVLSAARPFALAGDVLQGRTIMEHAYLGPAAPEEDIAALLVARRRELDISGCQVERIEDEAELSGRTAEAIASGAVVGWFQGRMEWGPRALGNRSIVCDPRRADMKDILNLKIKRRESFRPFAPSILREHVGAWFEEDGDVPFMMQVYQIREDKRRLIPAVTHVDGSGRLQTVHWHTNPRYWALIEAFRAATGVPLVLNTSFNENEPVVCRPDEALDCFLRTEMDVLVLATWLIKRVR
jgi:carbamoyltransferase